MRSNEDPQDDLKVTPPKDWAAGVPAVAHAMEYALAQAGPRRTALTLLNLNQAEGIDCPGCAWPDPKHRHTNEYCENGAKHVADEATTKRVTREFFAEHSIADLDQASDMWLNHQGRLTEPMVKRPGGTHYEPIGWDEAIGLLADEPERPGLPGRGDVLHLRTPQQRGRLPAAGSSPAPSAPTTCRTARTCATSRAGRGWGRPSASARAASPSTTSTPPTWCSWSARTRAPTTRGC
nr:hypothetical protein [Nocardioides convexus]